MLSPIVERQQRKKRQTQCKKQRSRPKRATSPSGSKTLLSIWEIASTSVRLGGVYALHHIAQEVEDYRKRVFEILGAHIRATTTDAAYKPRNADNKKIQPTIEIQNILNLLFNEIQSEEIYKGLQGQS